jgi:copper homeostasis protein
MVVVEVCVESVGGVRAARAAGAERVELCCALGEGGLTPSSGCLATAVAVGGIEVIALARPRGGDFLYAEDEFSVLERDVEHARALGAAGVALGCLTAEGGIDEERCANLIQRARPLTVTFHRAFDFVRAPEHALETLVHLGFARVLTSGQEASALEGRECIARLVRAARGRIEVVAAGGVRAENAAEIVRATGVGALHFAAATRRESPARRRNPQVKLASSARAGEEWAHWETDEARVRAVLAGLRAAGVEQS